MNQSPEDKNEARPTMDRRTTLKWIAAASASMSPLGQAARAAEGAAPVTAVGYGPDPVIAKVYQPGELWPLTFSEAQRKLVITLCDIIIPADDVSPNASSLGVHDFIDEWVSSPYPDQASDRKLILKGLTWLDEEAVRQGAGKFVALSPDQQFAACKDLARAAMEDSKKFPGSFFLRMRDLVSGGYYTTPVGMRDLQYLGNVAQAEHLGPTPEALAHLGLEAE